MSESPIELRQRAAELSSFASSIDALPVLLLARALGERAWIGPTASRCHDEICRAERHTVAAAADLRYHAQDLLTRAQTIENGSPGMC